MEHRKDAKETILGAGTSLKGTISFNSALTIKGQYEGQINSDGNLTIEEHATVTAGVTAANIELSGRLYGDADVTGLVELASTSTLIGDIKISSLKIDQGAIFKGRVSMLKNIDEIDLFSASPEQLKKLAIEQHSR